MKRLSVGWRSRALGVLLAIAGGFAASALGVPLAWVLGPMVATALLSVMGMEVFAPIIGRRTGQIIIGATIGLHITVAVAAGIVPWLPLMFVVGALSVVVSAILAAILSWVARISSETAYFGMLPGGLAEMASIGADRGADGEIITLCQASRIALVVAITPPLIISLGIRGSVFDAASAHTIPYELVPVVLLVALIGVGALRVIRFAAAWMVGALLAVGVASAWGLFDGGMPNVVFFLGQYFIGLNIGSRFKRETVLRLPSLAWKIVIFHCLFITALFALAFAVSLLFSIDLASAALALSPGGLAEMASTAQVLQLSTVLITGFHVVRAIIVNGFAMTFLRLVNKFSLFELVARSLSAASGRK